jgi:hypothetical protein
MTSQLRPRPPPGYWNGWPFDFSNYPHDDYGPQLNYGIWMLTAVSTGFLGLRVYCKFLRHRKLWWDDHVLIASWVSGSEEKSRLCHVSRGN